LRVRDAEQRHKAHERADGQPAFARAAKRRGQPDRQHAANQGERRVRQHQQQVPPIVEHHRQQQQDAHGGNAGVEQQFLLGTRFRLRGARERWIETGGEAHPRFDLRPRLVHERVTSRPLVAQVTVWRRRPPSCKIEKRPLVG